MDKRRFIIQNNHGDLYENGSEILIEGIQANHIKNVLRMKPGSFIILSDGTGTEYKAEIKKFTAQGVTVNILEKTTNEDSIGTSVSIAFGFLKENKIDELIRPLTELGIDRIMPFISERSISRPDPEKLKKKTERWNRMAAESIKQCRRSTVPEISCLENFREVMNESAAYDKKIIFYEKAGSISLFSEYCGRELKKPEKAIILIGPEGGFSVQEYEAAVEHGFGPYSLSKGILRAETAVISAAAIVQYLFKV